MNKMVRHFKMNDDRMTPIIQKGDELILTEVEQVESNRLYAVAIGDISHIVIGRVTKVNAGLFLSFANWDYPPTFYTNEEVKRGDLFIMGHVVESRHAHSL